MGQEFGSERLRICTETSNRLSKRVITSPKLSPKLSELTLSKNKTVYFNELQQIYGTDDYLQLTWQSKYCNRNWLNWDSLYRGEIVQYLVK